MNTTADYTRRDFIVTVRDSRRTYAFTVESAAAYVRGEVRGMIAADPLRRHTTAIVNITPA